MTLIASKFWAACFILSLAGCSAPSHGANEIVESRSDRPLLADEEYLTSLREDFLEVSGKDFVEFKKGSAALEPSAAFRLERQALWLRAYPMVAVRLVASGDGLERVADRRLAMARAQQVQRHLIETGVDAHQISGIDVEPPQSGNRRRVSTRIDLIQTAN